MRSDVQAIFKETPHDKQVMMFSATMAKEVRGTCKKFMNKVRASSKMSAQQHLAGHPCQAPVSSLSSSSINSTSMFISSSGSSSNTSIHGSNVGSGSVNSISISTVSSLQLCLYKQQVPSGQGFWASPAQSACRQGTADVAATTHVNMRVCWAVQCPMQLAAVACG
jgi:hypothetical protein